MRNQQSSYRRRCLGRDELGALLCGVARRRAGCNSRAFTGRWAAPYQDVGDGDPQTGRSLELKQGAISSLAELEDFRKKLLFDQLKGTVNGNHFVLYSVMGPPTSPSAEGDLVNESCISRILTGHTIDEKPATAAERFCHGGVHEPPPAAQRGYTGLAKTRRWVE